MSNWYILVFCIPVVWLFSIIYISMYSHCCMPSKALHGPKKRPLARNQSQNWARTARRRGQISKTAPSRPTSWIIRTATRTAKVLFRDECAQIICSKRNARNYFLLKFISLSVQKISSDFFVFHLFIFTRLLSTVSVTSGSLFDEPESLTTQKNFVNFSKTIKIAKQNSQNSNWQYNLKICKNYGSSFGAKCNTMVYAL